MSNKERYVVVFFCWFWWSLLSSLHNFLDLQLVFKLIKLANATSMTFLIGIQMTNDAASCAWNMAQIYKRPFKQQKVAFWILCESAGKFSSLVANGERKRKEMNAWCTWTMKISSCSNSCMQRSTMKMDIKQNRTAAMLSLWPHFFHAFLRFTSVLSYQNPSSRSQK